MADSPRTFLGFSQSPDFIGWQDDFDYAAGPLNGQGRWQDLGGFSGEWIETTGQVEIGPGNNDAGSTKSLKPYGINYNIPFTLYWASTSGATATDQVLFNVTCGRQSTPNTIIVRTVHDIVGSDLIQGTIDTPTQSSTGILGGYPAGVGFLWWLQYDGSDLILFASGNEVCRIVGASFPSIYPQICIEGSAPGTATYSLTYMQITEP